MKVCDRAAPEHAHQLSVEKGREYRGMDNIIYVTGSTWAAGGLTTYEVYRPQPGRQAHGAHPYQTANAAIALKLPGFRRWLAEWKKAKGY